MKFPQEGNSARSPESQKASKTVGQPERYLDSRTDGRTDTRRHKPSKRTKKSSTWAPAWGRSAIATRPPPKACAYKSIQPNRSVYRSSPLLKVPNAYSQADTIRRKLQGSDKSGSTSWSIMEKRVERMERRLRIRMNCGREGDHNACHWSF